MDVEVGVLPQCNGSARVRLLNGNTEIVASVKAELGAPPPGGAPNAGVAEVSVECWTSVSPLFSGRAAAEVNAELTAAVARAVVESGALDTRQLAVVPGKFVWTLYIDLLVLDSGGSLADTAVVAAVAALANTRLPRLRLVRGEAADDVDVTADDGVDGDEGVAVEVGSVPLLTTFCFIDGHAVLDARLEEEAVAAGRVQVAVDRSGRIWSVASDGGAGLPPVALVEAAECAAGSAAGLFAAIDAAIAAAVVADDAAPPPAPLVDARMTAIRPS